MGRVRYRVSGPQARAQGRQAQMLQGPLASQLRWLSSGKPVSAAWRCFQYAIAAELYRYTDARLLQGLKEEWLQVVYV